MATPLERAQMAALRRQLLEALAAQGAAEVEARCQRRDAEGWWKMLEAEIRAGVLAQRAAEAATQERDRALRARDEARAAQEQAEAVAEELRDDLVEALAALAGVIS